MSSHKPGLNGIKFHLLFAASRTACVIFILSNKIESSFISAMFKSRCVFSITFAASATFYGALIAALTTWLYKLSTKSAIFNLNPM